MQSILFHCKCSTSCDGSLNLAAMKVILNITSLAKFLDIITEHMNLIL